jgi:hypothetical protein
VPFDIHSMFALTSTLFANSSFSSLTLARRCTHRRNLNPSLHSSHISRGYEIPILWRILVLLTAAHPHIAKPQAFAHPIPHIVTMPDTCTSPSSSTPSTPSSKDTTMEPSLSPQDKAALHIPTPPPTSTESTAPATPELTPSRSLVTYCSTAVQIRPPGDASTFVLVHGREPTHQELVRKVGLAATGRYKGPTDTPHGVVYGDVFQRERNEHKPTTVASGFQTLDPGLCQKALTKAKVKAAMTAKRYQHIASEAGFKIWGESKDENVMHSQQLSFSIQLDANGVAQTDEDLTGRYLPNLYKEYIGPGNNPHHKIRTPKSHIMHNLHSAAMPSHDANPYPAVLQSGMTYHTQPLRPIPALEPSIREDFGDASLSEIYHGLDDTEESTGAYATDPDAFVVYDARKFSPVPWAHTDLPPRPFKRMRNDSSHIEDEEDVPHRKRTRTSSPRFQAAMPQDRHHVRAKNHEEHTGSRQYSLSCRSKTGRSLFSYKRKNRDTPDGEDASLHHSRREDSHGSRRRSRSRDCTESDRSQRPSVSMDRGNICRARCRSRSPVRTEGEADTKTQIELTHSSPKQSAASKELLTDSHQDPRSVQIVRAKDAQVQFDSTPNINAVGTVTSEHTPTSSSTRTTPRGANTIEPPAGSENCQTIHLKAVPSKDEPAHDTRHGNPQPHQRIQREELKRFAPRMQQDRSNSKARIGNVKAEVEPIRQLEYGRQFYQKTKTTVSDASRHGQKRSLDDSGPLISTENSKQSKKAKQEQGKLGKITDRQTSVTNNMAKVELKGESTKHPPKEIHATASSGHQQQGRITSRASSRVASPLKKTVEKKLRRPAEVDLRNDIKVAEKQTAASKTCLKKNNKKNVEPQQGIKKGSPQQNIKKVGHQQNIENAEHEQNTKVPVPQKESIDVKQYIDINEEDQRKQDVKAKIAERRANRGPRAERAVYVPRTMRPNQDASRTDQSGATNNRSNRAGSHGRGRRR